MIDRRRTLKPSLQHGQPTHLAAATHAAGTWHANWAQTRSAAADRPYPWWGDTNHHRCMGGKAAARDTASAVSGCNSASRAALAAHAHDADGVMAKAQSFLVPTIRRTPMAQHSVAAAFTLRLSQR